MENGGGKRRKREGGKGGAETTFNRKRVRIGERLRTKGEEGN